MHSTHDHELFPRLRRAVLAAALAVVGATTTLAFQGCNTVEGAGEDVEALGEGVQDAAD